MPSIGGDRLTTATRLTSGSPSLDGFAMTLASRLTFPFGPGATWRPQSHRWTLPFYPPENRHGREQLPDGQAERFPETLHRLHFDLRLSPALQLLIEFELKARDLGHLFLRKIGTEPDVAKILGKLLGWSHRSC